MSAPCGSQRFGESCDLAEGHDGAHVARRGDGAIGWRDAGASSVGFCRREDPDPLRLRPRMSTEPATPPAVAIPGGSGPLSEGDGQDATTEAISAGFVSALLPPGPGAFEPDRAEHGRLTEIERAAFDRGRLAERQELGDVWSTPTTARTLARHGWTNAEVTAALRNLLEDGDPRCVGWVLAPLADYRPGRGPGRRRSAGGTR